MLWNRGIGAKFFHYTRFVSIPVFFFAFGYSSYNMARKEMTESGVLDYQIQRTRFKRHSEAAKRIMQARVDYMKTKEDGDRGAVAIDEMVNFRENMAKKRDS